MFLAIPLSTDAPVYHWPVATVGLIAVNAAAFLGLRLDTFCPPDPGALVEPWLLHHGQGLHPTQWVSSIFLHGRLLHLLGNMVFLWVFGLLVEGKLGWWRFLIVYLGIGIGQSAVEQALSELMGVEGYSLGASSAVYGLMAISLIWAPLNVIEFFVFAWLFIFVRHGIYEVTVRMVALVYFGLDMLNVVLDMTLNQIQLTTSFLHLMGAAGGLGVGVVILKLEMVDCEGWDVFNVWRGKHNTSPTLDELRASPHRDEAVPKVSMEERAELASARLAHLINTGDLGGAAELVTKAAVQLPTWRPARAELMRLIREMQRQKQWSESVPMMVRCLQLYGEQDVRVRLTLAQILIQVEGRPQQALRVLAKLPRTALPEALERTRRQLIARAKQISTEGQLELETQDW